MTLDQIPSGTRVFLDSTIFVYHFIGASVDCRRCLERCERGEIKGVTSVTVLAEVTHRLMMMEALSRGLVAPGSVARKLRERPDIVKQLHVHRDDVEQIPLMGIDVVPLDLKGLLRAGELRRRHGLLTNDSLVATAALDEGLTAVASADADFKRLGDVELFQPCDLAS